MPDIDNAKRMCQLVVHRIAFTLEIDVMEGVAQSTIYNQLLAMNAWLNLHGYHRVSILFSGVLLEDSLTTIYDHIWYWTWFFEHKIYSLWEYVIVVNTLDPMNAGWHYETILVDYGIAISNLYSGFTTVWHEYGHHIEIYDVKGTEEIYCTNNKCVMSSNTNAFYYCWYHWHQRLYY